MMRHGWIQGAGALALTLGLAACGSSTATTAVGAGAAAAAAIAYNERGAESSVDADVTRIANATEQAFAELGITRTERKNEEDGIEVQGTSGEWKYVVDIERDPGDALADIEVTVSKDVADYSQDRAEQLLRAILARV